MTLRHPQPVVFSATPCGVCSNAARQCAHCRWVVTLSLAVLSPFVKYYVLHSYAIYLILATLFNVQSGNPVLSLSISVVAAVWDALHAIEEALSNKKKKFKSSEERRLNNVGAQATHEGSDIWPLDSLLG